MYHDKKSKSFFTFCKISFTNCKNCAFFSFWKITWNDESFTICKKTCKMYCLFSEFKIIFEKYNFLQFVKKKFYNLQKIFYNL